MGKRRSCGRGLCAPRHSETGSLAVSLGVWHAATQPALSGEHRCGRLSPSPRSSWLAGPTGVGVSREAIYVCDTYSRRGVRVEPVHAAEEICEIK